MLRSWLYHQFNVNHFENLAVSTIKLDPAGGLTSSAAGLAITNDLQDGRGVLNPAGGTIALPTIAGSETSINNGVAWNFGDFYLVNSAGTVGATVFGATEVPAMLIFNGSGDGTADAHWSIYKSTAATTNTNITDGTLVTATAARNPDLGNFNLTFSNVGQWLQSATQHEMVMNGTGQSAFLVLPTRQIREGAYGTGTFDATAVGTGAGEMARVAGWDTLGNRLEIDPASLGTGLQSAGGVFAAGNVGATPTAVAFGPTIDAATVKVEIDGAGLLMNGVDFTATTTDFTLAAHYATVTPPGTIFLVTFEE